MTAETVPQSKVQQVLERLGFQAKGSFDSHTVFEHPGTHALILLPQWTKTLLPTHVVGVRRTLVENGLIQEKEFERFVNQQ